MTWISLALSCLSFIYFLGSVGSYLLLKIWKLFSHYFFEYLFSHAVSLFFWDSDFTILDHFFYTTTGPWDSILFYFNPFSLCCSLSEFAIFQFIDSSLLSTYFILWFYNLLMFILLKILTMLFIYNICEIFSISLVC